MLSDREKAAFQDILETIGWIEKFIAGKTFEQYADDYPTRSMIERQILTLSEAAVQLGDKAEALCPEIPWKNIRGIGNTFGMPTIRLIQ